MALGDGGEFVKRLREQQQGMWQTTYFTDITREHWCRYATARGNFLYHIHKAVANCAEFADAMLAEERKRFEKGKDEDDT